MDHDVHRAAIAGGDVTAFGQWMAACESIVRDSLRSFARVIDVESVLQETLLRVWQVAPRFEPDGRPNALLRFTIRIARNLAISEVRRTKAAPVEAEVIEVALAAVDESPMREPDPLLRDAIADCRDKLPPKPREAFDARLANAGGDDDDTLASSLGMKLNTFLQNFTRARKMLADCLGTKGIAV
jgi:RNA polymerase sigma factor (sigma-70 family)